MIEAGKEYRYQGLKRKSAKEKNPTNLDVDDMASVISVDGGMVDFRLERTRLRVLMPLERFELATSQAGCGDQCQLH